jgi:hypothetical protein
VAVRKETIKQQFDEALPAVLEPGERVLGGAYGVSGPNPLWVQGLLGLAGFLHFGMRYYYVYVALTDRRLIFVNASFWTSRPQGFAWSDARDSITISDLQTDNKLWNWGKISSPTKQNLRMNFHAFSRPELKAMGDLLADRIVGAPGPGSRGRSGPVGRSRAACAADTASAVSRAAASTDFGGLTGRRETLCYPGAVPGV